jgi:hypothetical protein
MIIIVSGRVSSLVVDYHHGALMADIRPSWMNIVLLGRKSAPLDDVVYIK